MLRLVVMLGLLFLVFGCRKSRPDPRDHPRFKDTTDPSTILMPGGHQMKKPTAEEESRLKAK